MNPMVRVAIRNALVGIIHAAQGALALLNEDPDEAAEAALQKVRGGPTERTFGDDEPE